MKLNLNQFEQHLAGTLTSVYLICGDDPIQKQDALQALRKKAQQAEFTERVRLDAEQSQDEDTLYNALYSSSLMQSKTQLTLDYRSKAPAKAAAAILEKYAANPSPDHLLIIDMMKPEDTVTRSSWYKAVEKHGAILTIWPVAREQLPQWIMARAKKYKLAMQHDAAVLLADYVEGNLTAAAQAIEKIYLLKPEKPINAELVQSILADESRFTIFDLTESMITENKSRTLHILDTLRQDGIEAPIILWGITRELRILADIASEKQQGMTWDELFKRHRIFPRRQMGVRRFLERFTRELCYDCLRQAADIDHLIKGGTKGNSWDALQLLCLRLA